jgi:hypothetical protein
MKFSIDPWDPGYGASDTGELDMSTAEINLELERPVGEWAPISPAAGVDDPDVIWFCDGVRRVEARVWIDDDPNVFAGLCASYAAGIVRCDRATSAVVDIDVQRGLFTASPTADPILTPHGTFDVHMAASSAPDVLSLALQQQMTTTEIIVATNALGADDEGLLVIDGPLRGRQNLRSAVGLIKTHHTDYLPTELLHVLRALEAGQRTPVFTIGGMWTRHSWYLRLPGPGGSPRSGIVRCECSSDLTAEKAIAMANVTARVLPRYASEAHKDTRAPQNLYPIAGLERELRHRLGDPALMYRGLRQAAGMLEL